MDQDTLDKLASGEYSISPRSGRLRKRIRVKEKKTFFQRTAVRSALSTIIWVILVGGFIISLFYVIPELNIVSDKNAKSKTTKSK
jgi:hypothetical protein